MLICPGNAPLSWEGRPRTLRGAARRTPPADDPTTAVSPARAAPPANSLRSPRSREVDDLAVRVQVDPVCRGVGAEAGHGPHVAADGVDEPGPYRRAHLPY